MISAFRLAGQLLALAALNLLNAFGGLLLIVLVIVVCLAIRIVYETIMLPVRVYRVEKAGWPVEREPQGDDAWISWPEHLVAEDRGRVPKPAPWPAPPVTEDLAGVAQAAWAEIDRGGLTIRHHPV